MLFRSYDLGDNALGTGLAEGSPELGQKDCSERLVISTSYGVAEADRGCKHWGRMYEGADMRGLASGASAGSGC